MIEDTPDEYIHDLFSEAFWAGHPLSYPILGRLDTIGRMGGDWRVRAEPGRETALAELLGLFMVNYVLDPERLPAELITDLHRLAMKGPKTVGQLLEASGGGGRIKVRAPDITRQAIRRIIGDADRLFGLGGKRGQTIGLRIGSQILQHVEDPVVARHDQGPIRLLQG